MLHLLLVCFYPANGKHYLIETSDNSGEAVSGVDYLDYAEPGCIELRKRFSMTCVKEGEEEVDQPNCLKRKIKRVESRRECQKKCANFNLDQKRGKRCLYYIWTRGQPSCNVIIQKEEGQAIHVCQSPILQSRTFQCIE